jgi:hypothetical protein
MLFRWRFPLLVVLALFATASVAQTDQMTVTTGKSNYSCEDATKYKANFDEYKKLSSENQIVVDVTYQACQPDNVGKTPVIVRNADGKVGYGLLGKQDIRHLQQYCNNVATAESAVIGADSPVLGVITAIGAAGSCAGIANEISKNNSLVLIAPQAVSGAYSIAAVSSFVLSEADAKNVNEAVNAVMSIGPKLNLKGRGPVVQLPSVTVGDCWAKVGLIKTKVPC